MDRCEEICLAGGFRLGFCFVNLFLSLTDASVTQSALEEQLLSHMQHQGGLSKMSTISQALRSRYLP